MSRRRSDNPSAAALRQRRTRERAQSGLVHLAIDVPEVEIGALLVERGYLSSLSSDNPKAIGEALVSFLRAISEN